MCLAQVYGFDKFELSLQKQKSFFSFLSVGSCLIFTSLSIPIVTPLTVLSACDLNVLLCEYWLAWVSLHILRSIKYASSGLMSSSTLIAFDELLVLIRSIFHYTLLQLKKKINKNIFNNFVWHLIWKVALTWDTQNTFNLIGYTWMFNQIQLSKFEILAVKTMTKFCFSFSTNNAMIQTNGRIDLNYGINSIEWINWLLWKPLNSSQVVTSKLSIKCLNVCVNSIFVDKQFVMHVGFIVWII